MTHRCAAIFVLIALAAGCAPVNEEVGLLDAPPLPALDPGADTVRVRQDATPSITSHDRRHWDTQTVLVPLKQVEHRPHVPKQPMLRRTLCLEDAVRLLE